MSSQRPQNAESPLGVVSVSTGNSQEVDKAATRLRELLSQLPEVGPILLRQNPLDSALEDLQPQQAGKHGEAHQLAQAAAVLDGFKEWCEKRAEQTVQSQEHINKLIEEVEQLAADLLTKLQKSNLLMAAASKHLQMANELAQLPTLELRASKCAAQISILQEQLTPGAKPSS